MNPFLFSEKFATQVCLEDPDNPEILESEKKPWGNSLIQKITQLVLRLLKRIEDKENNVVDGVQRASPISKREFFFRLAKTMMEFRRAPNDKSSAILWVVSKSKRFGTQF
jgi:hypothetical protein